MSAQTLGIIAGAAALFVGATWAAAGGSLAEHSAYLGGIGNLPDGMFPFGFTEPANALSLPTCAHASTAHHTSGHAALAR